MTTTAIDERRVEEFAGTLFDTIGRSLLTLMIDLGHRTGLFTAAARGPATSAELADRAGLSERYVREWLAALVTGGVFEHEDGVYTLPAEHALCLTGGGSANLAPFSQVTALLSANLDHVETAFRTGGGVPYELFRPRFTAVMDSLSRGYFDGQLLTGVLPLTGLAGRLAEGIRVADVGCGTGHAVNLLARAFPASEFTGYDIAADAVDLARAEAADLGLTNARFEVRDAVSLPADPPLDAVFAFDAVHDQADPAGLLRAVHNALRPDGTFVVFDVKASSDLAEDVANPVAPMLYSFSVLHCMTVSLAAGGAGLGTMWGERVARRMLSEAGFDVVAVHDAPDDPVDCIYVCRKSK
ncbi:MULTISPECIES: class I SAM-dependent methyltransferase [unclassified Saccharothrix]|uniref:class I SAM-dependent methyltransferase n=1 Tax=unclassified Saccharothrix TaxID=2593673 RepID=UPI00307FCDCB